MHGRDRAHYMHSPRLRLGRPCPAHGYRSSSAGALARPVAAPESRQHSQAAAASAQAAQTSSTGSTAMQPPSARLPSVWEHTPASGQRASCRRGRVFACAPQYLWHKLQCILPCVNAQAGHRSQAAHPTYPACAIAEHLVASSCWHHLCSGHLSMSGRLQAGREVTS